MQGFTSWGGLVELGEIGQVLGTTHRALVRDEQPFAQEGDWYFVQLRAHLGGKRSSMLTPLRLVRRSIRCGARPS